MNLIIIGDYTLENFGKAEDASDDNVDYINEGICDVCLYDVENVVHSTKKNVEVQELFKDDRT